MYNNDKVNPGLKKAMGMAKKQMAKRPKRDGMEVEIEISKTMKPMRQMGKKSMRPMKKGMK